MYYEKNIFMGPSGSVYRLAAFIGIRPGWYWRAFVFFPLQRLHINRTRTSFGFLFGVNQMVPWASSGRISGFQSIDSTFEQLNIPSDRTTPYLIGQRSSDNSWLVYDPQKEQILIADNDYQKVMDVWYSLGFAQPTYVNARNTRELLIETKDSKVFRWKRDLQMYLFLGLIPFTPVALIFWYLSRKTKQQYKKTKSDVSLFFSYMFIVPIFVIIYMAISSLVAIIRQNW